MTTQTKVGVLTVMDALIHVAKVDALWPLVTDGEAIRAAVAELIERLEASNWRLANLLALIPEGRPERAQIEQDMADNRAALARIGGAVSPNPADPLHGKPFRREPVPNCPQPERDDVGGEA